MRFPQKGAFETLSHRSMIETRVVHFRESDDCLLEFLSNTRTEPPSSSAPEGLEPEPQQPRNQRLRGAGRLGLAGQADVAVVVADDPQSAVDQLFAEIEIATGPPDFLFYTAGILNIEPLAETSTDLWNRAVDINLNGAFYCIRAAAERMRKQRRGSIVVLGSIAGTKARSGSRVNPVYNATKAGLAAFVNASAMQLRGDGVRINCISPGPTETSMMGLQPPSVHTAVNQLALDNRMNDPVEVAELALFIAAHGRFTGEEICMGGGAGLGG